MTSHSSGPALNHGRISIGLVNPKSASNVAVILRAAGCYGVSSVFYTGKRYSFAKGFQEDTKGMRHKIPTIAVEDLMAMKPQGATTIAIELAENASPLPEFEHPENAYYIFGPEDGSVPSDVLEQCDQTIYIPTFTSMNLAATANVVLYDRLAKREYPHSNAFIRQSRDKNNNL
ncbi:RNA methyltransferase [Glaciecola sp. XM2]|uniref:RNA methyltransferase n=1 Tax=Glaciecola sp. XM2 TaxID=1914931 RepID=UPI001BDF63F9|nr:RNA methyltransferase [Glaciecola sp. XM2]MBT1451088.1 RNA methyltransferase [Glaciecola sp. XM2]